MTRLSIPTRQRCAACQQPSPVDFRVSDRMWELVVHPHFRNSVLCLPCFVSRADEKLIPWDHDIELYPISLHRQLLDVRGLSIFGEKESS